MHSKFEFVEGSIMSLNNKLGMIGASINVISVLLFAVFMLIPFDFGSYFVCMFLSIGFVMMIAAFEQECSADKKTAGKTASIFAGMYAVLVFIVYTLPSVQRLPTRP